jgi:hypothetical protein
MKSVFRNTVLLSALLLVATERASANQLLVFVTVQDILTGASAALSNCNAGMTDCGIYGVGFAGAAGGSAAATASAGYGYLSPVPSGQAVWSAFSLNNLYPGFEAGGSSNGATREQLMTYNTATAVNTYNANLGLNPLQGLAAMNTSTQIGFIVDFGSSQIAAGTTTNLTLRVLATGLNTTTGAQSTSKNQGDFITINGVALSPVPEPSTIALLLSGCLLAVARRKNRA